MTGTETPARTSRRARRPRKRPPIAATLGFIWLAGVFLMSLFADWIPFVRRFDQKVRVDGRTQGNFRLGPGSDAWFGTDQAGTDVFAKCVYGARMTLIIGVCATAIGLVAGGILGVMAGYFKGWVDRVISFITEILLSVPALVIALVVIFRFDEIRRDYPWWNWFGRGWQVTLLLSILAVAPLTRIVRAQTLSLAEREFVLAARSLGAKPGRVLFREILPNVIPAMISVAFTGLGILISAEGGLSFLGFGLEGGAPTWGRMIASSARRIDPKWWAALFPALCLYLTVLSFNLIGDRLARRFDIREATL